MPSAKAPLPNKPEARLAAAPGFGKALREAERKEIDGRDEQAKDADLKRVSAGAEAPDITAEGLDGKLFNLSDIEGKVIVVTFWADWHKGCRHQYGAQRELVEKMKQRPFAMVGVNCDEDRAEAQKVAEREKMTWKNFWDGRWGRITQEWHVQTYPMTFVIDHKGIIRHRNLNGKELEAAVENLVKEAEAK